MLEMLNEMYEYLHPKEKAIISFLNARHLRFRDEAYAMNSDYQEYLYESLKYQGSFVNNRVYLAELYTKNKAARKAKLMYQEAINNVIKVFTAVDLKSMTDEHFAESQTFIDEYILGTHLSCVSYEILIEKGNV
jgi:hypothetical protein